MKKLAYVLLVTLGPMIGCDRTPGVRSSQGGGGAANAPATERSPEPSPLGCASIGLSPSPSPTSAPGWELPDDVVPGLAMGFTVGVAVGMAVGEGIGEVPGAASELVPARIPEFGVGTRIPEGIPGAAGRTPSGLASVEPALFGAGPTAEGRLTEPPC